ncbi:uncharacterized protein LOC125240074 [Leguminivora glycinivorella]|uniref:uncharacterized protein LOC125240074 n=1 Tax=Leguminivora glycinivorella TaxID=1035111 RepID=UPI00200CF0BB|nr:uncharacterized protein LOC125240074 [Leguminivora glycinivorella]
MSEIVEIYVKEQRQVEDSLQDVNDTEASNTGRYEDAEKEEIIVEPEVSGLLAVTHEEDDPIWEERSSQYAWDARNTTYVQRDSGTQPELSPTFFSPEQMEAAAAIASSILKQTQGELEPFLRENLTFLKRVPDNVSEVIYFRIVRAYVHDDCFQRENENYSVNVSQAYSDRMETCYANTDKTATSYYVAHFATGNVIEHASNHDGNAI